MPSADKLIMFIILFVAVGLLALGAITMLSKQAVPDANETPELYQEYLDQQGMSKPFLYGLNGIIAFILIIIVLIGVSIAVRSFMRHRQW
jgi:hypothetical protein